MASSINDMFNNRLSEPGGREKLAAYGSNFVRDRLREVSFVRKLIPPEQVTRADCKPSIYHDTLVKFVELEPQSRAMAISFRGQPKTRLIRADRTELAFFTITSEQFQKTEQELLAYESPITKIIEENSVKDIQEIEDREFILHAEAGIQALQVDANGGVAVALNSAALQGSTPPVEFSVRKGELARSASSVDATVRPLQRKDIVEGFKMLDGNRLRCENFLLTEADFDDVLTWTVEDNGDRIQSETTVDGYKYNTLVGRSFIRTIKTDILRRGNVYFFTSPEFFGKFYILNQTKFYIDKVANMITFQAWEDIAMGIVNVASSRKIELYSADASSLDADGLRSNFLPVAEDALGALNNRVTDGLQFPMIAAR